MVWLAATAGQRMYLEVMLQIMVKDPSDLGLRGVFFTRETP